jgi:hypothetical protein
MPALNIALTIPVGGTGHISLDIDVPDLAELSAEQRQVLADTGREFFDFAAATLTPPVPPAEVHDPDAGILAGVTGSRANQT